MDVLGFSEFMVNEKKKREIRQVQLGLFKDIMRKLEDVGWIKAEITERD